MPFTEDDRLRLIRIEKMLVAQEHRNLKAEYKKHIDSIDGLDWPEWKEAHDTYLRLRIYDAAEIQDTVP